MIVLFIVVLTVTNLTFATGSTACTENFTSQVSTKSEILQARNNYNTINRQWKTKNLKIEKEELEELREQLNDDVAILMYRIVAKRTGMDSKPANLIIRRVKKVVCVTYSSL